MSPDTDPDIRRLLERDRAPDHGDDFWSTLRDDLGGDAPLRLDRTSGGRDPMWFRRAAAAAVILVIAGVGVYLATDDPEPVPVISDPDPTTSTAPDGSSASGALRPDGALEELGSGQVVAVDPGGEWLYVTAPHPDGGRGCEGALRQSLYVQPTAGGDRLLATDASIDVGGAAQMRFGPDDSVAVLSQCESFLSGLTTGSVGPDGVLADTADLPVDDLEIIVDFAWARPGTLMATTYSFGADVGSAESSRRLVEIDARTGAQTVLPPSGYLFVDVTADGTVVSSDSIGTVRFGDEVLGTDDHFGALGASDDGRFVATGGEKGVTVYDREAGTEQRVSDAPAHSLTLLDDGVLVFTERSEGATRVRSVSLTNGEDGDRPLEVLFSDEDLGRLTYTAVSPDGSDLWVSYLVDDAPLPVLVRQPLIR